jgi:AcrR family transcriptional regulator
MFNERGIEYVGLREIAADLNMRVSNITYYFPTKDDLVYELSKELSETNAQIIVAGEKMTMEGFLKMLHQVFRNQLRFKCLMLSFVHVMKQNKRIATTYKETQKKRYATIKTNLKALVTGGYLVLDSKEDLEFLVSAVALISRFWISEAAVSFTQMSDEAQMKHYLVLVTKMLMPYATEKGKREMDVFLR